MSSDEYQVFEAGRKSAPFSRYGDLELQTAVELLIYKITVLTGWKLPAESIYTDELTRQFVCKIKEDYQHLNTDEVQLAFRKYGATVEDWGNAFNLSLIVKVLDQYAKEKAHVADFVERKAVEYKPETRQADWKELCELNYQQFLTGTYHIELWPWQLYDEFVNCNMMASDVYEDFLKPAYYLLISKPCSNAAENSMRQEIKEQCGKHSAVIEMAKRMAVELLYQTAKDNGFKNLFQKVNG